MKRKIRAVPGGVMMLMLASFILPWDTISFGPRVGSTVSKTFEGRFELALDSLTMTMDGKEHDMGQDGAREGCTGTYSVAVNDGALDMSMAMNMGDFDVEFALAASLGLKQEATAADAE